ncbi:hypothetical protein HDA40_008116 [Hamadaea flava]|uniref:Uncharacterized protein n=1 Tax=Hamadaea flava TaxID=1742688 RepID=A0ABV8LNG6_9ACTN|nr:hypothetical protein [Hamadaea flava]MCP2329609.1 hypothetical protein [Hamadaea flava]
MTVDRELDEALTDARESGSAEPDGHDVYLNDASPETAAVLVLFHQTNPSYSALMYLRFVWNGAGQILRDWIVRQFATMLVHGPEPVAESARLALNVDYFEDHRIVDEVFDRLLAQVPLVQSQWLLRAGGPVPWPRKRSLFLAAAEVPGLHASLAEGIAASFYRVYGDVDAPEAAELVQRIDIADDEIRSALIEATTGPMLMRTGSAIVVTDARWAYPDSFLLEMAVAGSRTRWSARPELVVDGQLRGRLMHWSYPFQRELEHDVLRGPAMEKAGWNRIEAHPADAADWIDREVEVWPRKLREYLSRR